MPNMGYILYALPCCIITLDDLAVIGILVVMNTSCLICIVL